MTKPPAIGRALRAEYDSLLPPLKLGRRDFLATTLAAGFAAAAGPVVARVVATGFRARRPVDGARATV